ncbi:hypothetical protein B9G98_01268 [Wickerhamiella sorbophila]|uniref:Uncharacterized protein n=1 Tax=Wickerhamiella sorbophila TaxID=45607 RepID=A0A2T0FF84_9ASCO|nr:hypothetical protein B9G98_01268 [Wickerhamiella sorbophila]PRT53648.1 hypothetical protein B9G98_01268 [Wickerhamiella sorbophila]
MGSSFSCMKEKETPEHKGKPAASKKQPSPKATAKDTPKSPQAESTLISADDVAAKRHERDLAANDQTVPVTREETVNSHAAPRRQMDIQIDSDLPQNFKV